MVSLFPDDMKKQKIASPTTAGIAEDAGKDQDVKQVLMRFHEKGEQPLKDDDEACLSWRYIGVMLTYYITS